MQAQWVNPTWEEFQTQASNALGDVKITVDLCE